MSGNIMLTGTLHPDTPATLRVGVVTVASGATVRAEIWRDGRLLVLGQHGKKAYRRVPATYALTVYLSYLEAAARLLAPARHPLADAALMVYDRHPRRVTFELVIETEHASDALFNWLVIGSIPVDIGE